MILTDRPDHRCLIFYASNIKKKIQINKRYLKYSNKPKQISIFLAMSLASNYLHYKEIMKIFISYDVINTSNGKSKTDVHCIRRYSIKVNYICEIQFAVPEPPQKYRKIITFSSRPQVQNSLSPNLSQEKLPSVTIPQIWFLWLVLFNAKCT